MTIITDVIDTKTIATTTNGARVFPSGITSEVTLLMVGYCLTRNNYQPFKTVDAAYRAAERLKKKVGKTNVYMTYLAAFNGFTVLVKPQDVHDTSQLLQEIVDTVSTVVVKPPKFHGTKSVPFKKRDIKLLKSLIE